MLVHRSRCKSVVAYDVTPPAGDVDLGGVCLLVCPGKLLEPTVEDGIATIKRPELVLTPELFNDVAGIWIRAHGRRWATWVSLKSFLSRGLACAGRLRAS